MKLKKLNVIKCWMFKMKKKKKRYKVIFTTRKDFSFIITLILLNFSFIDYVLIYIG